MGFVGKWTGNETGMEFTSKIALCDAQIGVYQRLASSGSGSHTEILAENH